VLFFAPLPEELDVWPLLGEALRSGKRVFLPRFVGEKPLKRFGEDAEPPSHPQLKQGVNDSETPLKQGAHDSETCERGKYVVCEVRDPKGDIRAGQFGIREPLENCAELALNRLDLILVPGVAFD